MTPPGPLPVECPWCLVTKKHHLMVISHVLQGNLNVASHEGLPGPYWRYKCPSCKNTEYHDRLLRKAPPK